MTHYTGGQLHPGRARQGDGVTASTASTVLPWRCWRWGGWRCRSAGAGGWTLLGGFSLTQIWKPVGTPEAGPPSVSSQSHAVAATHWPQGVRAPGVRSPVLVVLHRHLGLGPRPVAVLTKVCGAGPEQGDRF